MEKHSRKHLVALRTAWKRISDISTAAWLWSFLPSGVVSGISGWLAYGEGLPKTIVFLVAIGVLTLCMIFFTALRIWHSIPTPVGPPPEELAYREELARQRARHDAKRQRDFNHAIAEMFGGNFVKSLKTVEKDREAAAEANRQRMIREAGERRANQWIPLHAALKYIVYESDWACRQPRPSQKIEFDRAVSLEFMERLARGDVRARGVKGNNFSNPDKPTEEIPPTYWTDGFIQPHGEIVMADSNRAAAGNPIDGCTYRRVILRADQLERTWPRSESNALSGLASFVEPDRKAYAESKGIARTERSDPSAPMDITLAEAEPGSSSAQQGLANSG